MDSHGPGTEKGITIRAKNAAFKYKNYHINIVDTPGHADFGGEVERIMNMIDGVLLVVDAADGPQAQTRFVLRKALEAGAKPIVVINKIDRENANPHEGARQGVRAVPVAERHRRAAGFPGHLRQRQGRLRQGRTSRTRPGTMEPLFDAIIKHIPPPRAQAGDGFPDARVEPGLQRLPRPNRLRANLQRHDQGGRQRGLHPRRRPARARKVTAIFPPRAWRGSRCRTPTPATSSA